MRWRAVTPLALVAAAGAAYGQCDPIEDPIKEKIEQVGVKIDLELVVDGMTAPLWAINAPGPVNRLYVVDQAGILWSVNPVASEMSVFLDVSGRIVELGAFGPGTFDERGLLGVAFHPNYPQNGLLYTYESHPVGPPADFSTMPEGVAPNHQTVISEWKVPNPTDPNSVVDPNSARELLRIDQPQFNHNAGAMHFGPDGFLYIALGDGGGADDEGVGHPPMGNGQDTSTILGNLIRIDPLGNNSENGKYGIPADNPFVGKAGVDEIFAFGFRNPYRFSFDMLNGKIWVGDAGQHQLEEVDVAVKGGNYGWPLKEGSFFFFGGGPDVDGFICAEDPGVPPGLIDPVAEYDHDEGVVVIGGFVYRGSAIPSLQGRYVFGDYSASGNNDGRLFHLTAGNTIVEFQYADDDFDGFLLGFGQDAAGEVYALGNMTGVPFEKTGFVMKLVSAGCFADCDGSGDLNLFDFLCFTNQFNNNDPAADCDGSGTLNAFDFLCFVNNFNAGC